MEYNKIYLVNYNKFLTFDTDKLLDIVFYSDNRLLKCIAIDVLLNDDRLFDKEISSYKLYQFVNLLTIEQLAYFCNFDNCYPIVILSKMKFSKIIDMSFYKNDDDNVPFYVKK